MTDDLISKATAIEALGEKPLAWVEGEYELGLQNQWERDVDAIKALPSAQPEIIRCKDCKHIQKWRSEESAKKFGQIYECARNVLDCPKPEDFCSHAERKTDG